MNNHNEHIEQDKHLNDPKNGETILAHNGKKWKIFIFVS